MSGRTRRARIGGSCLGAVVALGLAGGARALPQPPNRGQRPAVTFAQLRSGFRQPDMAYAPFAFWFWDAPLDARRAADMAAQMTKQRLNPGYAHARMAMVPDVPPLPKDDWLSPRWFGAFAAALGQAEAAGAYLGYCDEYWWPSGQAAGRVVKAHPELKPVSLAWTVNDVPGGSVVELPASFFTVAGRHASAGGLPERPRDPQMGRWIWHPTATGENTTVFFRAAFDLPPGATVKAARVKMTADNTFVLYANGQRIGQGLDWRLETPLFAVASALRPGPNVLAVEAANLDGLAGLIAGLHVELGDGSSHDLATDGRWRVSDRAAPGWTEPGFDDRGWPRAAVVGETHGPPWNLSFASPHAKATLRSGSLRLLGTGKPFAWRAPAGGTWRVYSFTTYEHPGDDGGGVNYLDARLAPTFIGMAHAPYAARFGARMGRSIPGVFVDNEGDYGYKLAWSDTVMRRYRAKTGRDIRLWMPLLVDEDSEGVWARARWDWFDAVSDVYADGFFGAVSRWLGQHGMYCISNLWEESLMWQAAAVGDFFKAQRAVSMPGNDCLVRKALEVHDFKETQSVTEFEGRRFMSEVLGVAGWGMSPVLMKQAANAVTAWRVSHIVPHGVFTTRQLRGNPWPPDWYTENPYFRYLHQWTDFCRRASFVNAHGRLVPDVLLLSPMDSVWALSADGLFDPERGGGLFDTSRWFGTKVHEIDRVYSEAISALTAARVEFLVADRHYVRRMAVRKGRLESGSFSFRAVVLPPMVVLPLDEARKVVAFARSGGRVYILGDLPAGSTDAGMGDARMARLMAELRALPAVATCAKGLAAELADPTTRLTSQIRFLEGAFAMLQQHRRIDGRDFYWLANNTAEARACRVAVRGAAGAASIWDCETGATRPVPSAKDPGGSVVGLVFRPYEAYWLVFDPQARERVASPPPGQADRTVPIAGPWTWRIDPSDQPVTPNPVTLPADLAGGASVERPLESWNRHGLERFTGFVDYTTTFQAEPGGGRVVLDLGQVAHMAEVWLNGRKVGERLWPPHDFDITAAVRPGANALRVRVGNLVANNMGELLEAGLMGPVVMRVSADPGTRPASVRLPAGLRLPQ